MKILDLLKEKGFVEGVDFSLTNTTLTALEQSRVVQIPEVPELKDEAGNIIREGVPASQKEEKYFKELPSVDSLMREALKRSGVAEKLVNNYIATKTAPEGSLNIHLFVEGGDGWRLTNISAPSIESLYNQIDLAKEQVTQEALNQQAREFLALTDWKVLRELEKLLPDSELKKSRADVRGLVVDNPKPSDPKPPKKS